MTIPATDPTRTLRLIWPQWQGAPIDSVASFIPELPIERAIHGTEIGAAVLQTVLERHDGPTAVVPSSDDASLELVDGVYAKAAVIQQLAKALATIAEHGPDRIVTIGGDCSVSIAPFSALAEKYGDDLAVIWFDSHPDVSTPGSSYTGHQAMGVAALTGHGHPEILAQLPGFVDPARVALAGMHSWFDDDPAAIADWGLATFDPSTLRSSSAALLEWLRSTGCSRLAIHFDVDTIDSNEFVFGLAAEPGGLSSAQLRRIITELSEAADVVGFTVAEYIPRQVIALRELLRGMPLL